ncbi:MAG: hypothetical protein HY831_03115 [Candidatus Aenigmarchaeota archaeon]|nr:hypothetical protein [Candidatus Aenigmarchaeota archaeon]
MGISNSDIKIVLIFLFTISFLLSVSHATPVLNRWDNVVEINEDETTHWDVTLNYSEAVDKSDYFIFARIFNVRVYSEDGKQIDCDLQYKDVGSLIICENILSRNISIVKYSFYSRNQIVGFNEFRMFRHSLSITDNLEYFSIIVKLPLGSTLADKSKLVGTPIAPFEPAYGQEGSDGRKISVKWELKKPRLGEPINISILYENLPFGLELWLVVSLVIVVVFISILTTYYFKKVKVDVKSFLNVLSEGERKVMEIVIREKKVDQRIIVRETDFSKAKVSRIIQSLSSRDLIDAIPKGRTKLITFRTVKKGFFDSFNEMRKSRKISSLKLSKEQAIELSRFIKNIIEDLNQTSKNIEKKEYTKIKQIKIPQKLNILYGDVKKLYPTVHEELDSYNEKASIIENDIMKASQNINKKFRKSFEKLLTENNLEDHIAKEFPELIINNKSKIDSNYSEFWQANNKGILKARQSRDIKSLIDVIEKSSEELEKDVWEFKEDLTNLMEDIRKSYNILVKDIYD